MLYAAPLPGLGEDTSMMAKTMTITPTVPFNAVPGSWRVEYGPDHDRKVVVVIADDATSSPFPSSDFNAARDCRLRRA
jgi:hypothetical protein